MMKCFVLATFNTLAIFLLIGAFTFLQIIFILQIEQLKVGGVICDILDFDFANGPRNG